jgi:hypothetical protein
MILRTSRQTVSTDLMRLILTTLLLLVLAALAGDLCSHAADAGRQAPPITADELKQLLIARYQAASALLEIDEKRLNEGRTTLTEVCEAGRRVRDAAMELTGEPEEQVAALTKYLAVTRRLENSVAVVVEGGLAPPSDRELARYIRLDAEIALFRSRHRHEPSATTPPSPPAIATRKAIAEKLEQIQTDLPAGSISLTNLVRTLAAQAKALDPAGNGINFIISAQGTGLDTASVRLGRDPVARVSLADALNIMISLADRPVLYTIEDYGVVIAPRSPSAESSQTRLIKVNPDTFKQGLQAIPR